MLSADFHDQHIHPSKKWVAVFCEMRNKNLRWSMGKMTRQASASSQRRPLDTPQRRRTIATGTISLSIILNTSTWLTGMCLAESSTTIIPELDTDSVRAGGVFWSASSSSWPFAPFPGSRLPRAIHKRESGSLVFFELWRLVDHAVKERHTARESKG
jgi:hypothetical protein